MKTSNESNNTGLLIPVAALKMSNLAEEPLTAISMEKATVIIPAEMEVMGLASTINSLYCLADCLIDVLGKKCGECNLCGSPTGERDCWAEQQLDPFEIKLPDWVLEEAGIDKNAKLTCSADEESGEITVWSSDEKFDLLDLPPRFLEAFRSAGY